MVTKDVKLKESRKKEPGDKGAPDILKQDKVDAISWALVIIWAGLLLLAGASGYMDNFGWWKGGERGLPLFFAGAGIIVLALTSYRLYVPEYRRKIKSGYIFGLILLALALSGFVTWPWFWPVVIIGIGAWILFSSLYRKPA